MRKRGLSLVVVGIIAAVAIVSVLVVYNSDINLSPALKSQLNPTEASASSLCDKSPAELKTIVEGTRNPKSLAPSLSSCSYEELAASSSSSSSCSDADLNGDGQVDGSDLALLLGTWGGHGAGDVNQDGMVNGIDLALLLSSWGSCTPEGFIEVCTPEDLDNVRNNLTGNYIQICDIDMNGYDWEPIGKNGAGNFFHGVYDGDGHTISNLYYKNLTRERAGLFGMSNGNLNNIYLENVSMTAKTLVGGLVGVNNIGIVSNCHVNGKVDGSTTIGILMGYNAGIIRDSSSNGTILANYIVGGLVGENSGVFYGEITNSSSYVIISGGGPIPFSIHGVFGGLVGHHSNTFGQGEASISQSSSSGSVVGDASIGGLIGQISNGAVVKNSYSNANVYGGLPINGVGGLIGDNIEILDSETKQPITKSVLINSYSSGYVNGLSTPGGLIGTSMNMNITNSYWDVDSSGQTTSAGGIGLSTEEMQMESSFAGWDFNNIWEINEGQSYPFLQWQI